MTRLSQLSAATTSAVKFGKFARQAAPRAKFRLVAHCKITGVVPRTMTLKVLTLLIPKASSAKQVTTLVPSAKREPEEGLHVTGTIGWHKLVAKALNEITVPAGPAHSAKTLDGEEI